MVSIEDRITDAGYEDVVVFANDEYDTAFIGITDDGRAVYDYDKMVEYLMERDGMTDTEAIEWIEYNTIRALPYMPGAPVIIHRI